MPAEIIFENSDGIELNRQPIVRKVSRIGSNSECDLVFAGLQEHAFTLRYTGDKYVLTNRLAASVRVGEKTLESGGSLTWTNTAKVDVEGLLFLKLQCDSNDDSPNEPLLSNPTHSHPVYPAPESAKSFSVHRNENDLEVSGFEREHTTVDSEDKPPILLLAIAAVMTLVVGFVFMLDGKSIKNGESEPTVTLSETSDAFQTLTGNERLPPDVNFAALQSAIAGRVSGRDGTTRQTLIRTRDWCEVSLRKLENPAIGDTEGKQRASLLTIWRFCLQQLKTN